MPRRHSQDSLRLRAVTGVAVAVGVLALQGAANAEVNFSVEATAGYTNNLLRVPEGDAEVPVSLGLTGIWQETTSRLSADVEGRVDGITYLNDSFDDEVLGQVDGSVTWWALPERLSFVLESFYGQIATDPFTPISPENRQNTNFLSTGPDLFVPMGERTYAYLGGRYESVRYEVVDSDNERLMAMAGIDRALSPNTQLGLRLRSESVDYDSELQSDFNRHEAYVSYQYSREQQQPSGFTRSSSLVTSARAGRSARAVAQQSGVAVNAGYTWLTGDIESSSLPFLEAALSRQLSPSLTVGLALASRFYDAGVGFAAEGPGLPGGGSAVGPGGIPEAGVYEERSVGGSVDFRRQRTTIAAAVEIADETYETAALDRRRFNWRIEIERRMNRRLTGSAEVRRAQYQYELGGLDREDTDIEYLLELRRELGRRASLSIVGLYASRSSDDPLIEFDETRGYVVFSYSLR